MSGGVIETIQIIEPWIYETLSGDSQLAGMVEDRISGTLSPVLLGTPYVTFLLQSPLDIIGIGGTLISTDNLYIVKAVTQTSTWDDLLPIAQRIDLLLHRPGQIMTEEFGSLTCIRERRFQQAEEAGDLQYRHLGSIFRIRASADN